MMHLRIMQYVLDAPGNIYSKLKKTLLKLRVPMYTIRNAGRGDALVETMTFNRMVVGSTPALAAT